MDMVFSIQYLVSIYLYTNTTAIESYLCTHWHVCTGTLIAGLPMVILTHGGGGRF